MLRVLLSRFEEHFSDHVISELRAELGAGEYGVAFHLLCNILFEQAVVVPNDAYEMIDTVGRMMRLDESEWRFLKSS